MFINLFKGSFLAGGRTLGYILSLFRSGDLVFLGYTLFIGVLVTVELYI